MTIPSHLGSAAHNAHSLALALYSFTARWPGSERDGLTLETRRAALGLARTLAHAEKQIRGCQLLRTVEDARQQLASLEYLVKFATDLGYRKLAPSKQIDEGMEFLHIDLDLLAWEVSSDAEEFEQFEWSEEFEEPDGSEESDDSGASDAPARGVMPRGGPGNTRNADGGRKRHKRKSRVRWQRGGH